MFTNTKAPRTDEKRIDRVEDVAWFTDPAGNILSVCASAEASTP